MEKSFSKNSASLPPPNYKPAALLSRVMAALVDMIFCVVGIIIANILLAVAFFRRQASEIMVELEVMQKKAELGIIDPTDPFFLEIFSFMLVSCLCAIAILHLYFIAFEYRTASTPGKRLFGLRVVSLVGPHLTLKQVIQREMMRTYVDFSFIVPALVAMAATEKRQRVGDLVAKTMVVDSGANRQSHRPPHYSGAA